MSGAPPDARAAAGAETAALIEALRDQPGGVMLFDPPPPGGEDGAAVLRFVNDAMLRELGVGRAAVRAGMSLGEVIGCMARLGAYGPGDPARIAREVLARDRSRPSRTLMTGSEGHSWLSMLVPRPAGGWIVSVVALAPQDGPAAQRASLLAGLLDRLQSGFALYGPDGRLLAHNRAYPELAGLPAGALRPGMDFRTVQRLGGASEAEALVDRRVPDVRLQRLGDGRVVRASSRPLEDGHWMLELEDATPLRRAEEETERRAALLDGVLRAMPHGVVVYDGDQRVSVFNAAYAALNAGSPVAVGDRAEDVLRRRAATGEFGDVPVERVLEDYRDLGLRPTARVRPRPDGTMLDIRTAPLPGGGHVAVLTDVSALHRAEAEARRRADEVRAILDNLRHGVALFDAENRLVTANLLASRMTGLPDAELRPGRPLIELHELQVRGGEIPATDSERVMRAGLTARQSRYRRRRPDGSVLEVTTDPMPGGGHVRTYADVTAEARAQEATERARDAAEAASLAKSRFLAGMSHELRTPLNAVIGFSEMIAEATPGTPAAAATRAHADAILEAGRHLLSLIDDILDVARAEAAPAAAEAGLVSLPRALDGAARLLQPAAGRGGVELLVEAWRGPPLPAVRADARRLHQVLLNLVGNAVKFTPAGGRVSLAARRAAGESAGEAGGGVEVVVADTGIGMEPAEIPRAFEAFTQLDGGPARRYGGSGLGLTLARAMAEAMGMRLVISSRPGLGTEARLLLPPALLDPGG